MESLSVISKVNSSTQPSLLPYLPTTFMRASMDKNDENEEIETSMREIKIYFLFFKGGK